MVKLIRWGIIPDQVTMKKFTLFITIFIFCVFVLIGYLLASSVGKNTKDSPLPPTPETQEILQQSNYLVFLVDDFQSKKPQLLAIWSVLVSEPSPKKMFFFSLFPTINFSTNDQLISIFALRNNSTLTASSMRRLKRVFDLKIDGYFIIDNASYLSLAANAGIDQLEIISETPRTVDEVKVLRFSTSKFFNTLCDLFSSGATTSFFSKVDWNALMPAHLVSDKTSDEMKALTDQLSSQSEVNTCRVILP